MPDRQSPDRLVRLVRLIGIGVGNPDHITHEAAAALQDTDVVFTVDKGGAKRDLNELRAVICHRHGGPGLRTVEVREPERHRAPADYAAEVTRWHGAREEVWEQALREHLPPGGRGAFLVWGDPSLYDSTLRILDGVGRRMTVSIEVVPGITSIQVLAARHRIPTMYFSQTWVESGGLVGYGPAAEEQWRLVAGQIDKILKGAQPANLPVQQPTRFELSINLKTARALGMTIPRALLLRADHVIE